MRRGQEEAEGWRWVLVTVGRDRTAFGVFVLELSSLPKSTIKK